jgi:transcriptional regulator with XRE-family HTH domain
MATDCHPLPHGRRTVRYMADIGKAPEGFPRRMQAARALAGLTIEQLAAKLTDEPGLSDRSLRNIENGSAHVPRSRQRIVIEACGVPSAFIDADLWLLEAAYDALGEIPQGQREQTGDDVLISRALRLLAKQPDAATVEDRIARLERMLATATEAAQGQGATDRTGRDADDGPVGPLPGAADAAEAPAQQRRARGQSRTRR